jgi:hypothetical protein
MLALPIRLIATLHVLATTTPRSGVRSIGISQLIVLVFEFLTEVVATLEWLVLCHLTRPVIVILTRVYLAALTFVKIVGALATAVEGAPLIGFQWLVAVGDIDRGTVCRWLGHESLDGPI